MTNGEIGHVAPQRYARTVPLGRVLIALTGPYLIQGLAYGFAGWVLLPHLAAKGVPLAEQAGLLAWGGLPWVFKALWGPLLDRARAMSGGLDPRRAVIVAQTLVAGAMATMALVSDPAAHVRLLAWAWFGQNVLLSLQDVATDTLALDALPEGARARANALMLGAHHLGAELLAALGLGWCAGHLGLQATVGILAASALLLAPLPALAPRPRRRMPASGASFWRNLGLAFSSPLARRAAAIASIIFAADQLTSSASATFLVGHLRWTTREIQVLLSPVALISTLSGYAVAALAADRLGHRASAALGSVGLGSVWIAFALATPLWGTIGAVLTMVALQGLCTGLLYAGVHAWLMDATDPKVRATQFVAFMALLNLPRAVAPHLAAPAVAALGFAGLFAACGAFQVALGLALSRDAKHPVEA